MDCLTALGDPTRRRIVELLSRGERAAGEIVERFDVSAPAISQHLKVLREAQMVSVRAEAQRRIYELDPQGVNELTGWVDELRSYWASKFDALEAELRKPAGKPRKR